MRNLFVDRGALQGYPNDTVPSTAYCHLCKKGTKEEKPWVVLPKIDSRCGHVFHQECFEKWTKKSIQCPVCHVTLFTCYDPREDYALVKESLHSLFHVTTFWVVKNLFLLESVWRESRRMVRVGPEVYANCVSLFKLTDIFIKSLMIYESYRAGKGAAMYAGLVRSMKIIPSHRKVVIKTFCLLALKVGILAAAFSWADPWLISTKILPSFWNRVTVVLGSAFMGFLSGNQEYMHSGLFSFSEKACY